MLRVGLDAAPLWHSANGVWEDTALSLLHSPLLLFLLLPFPSPSLPPFPLPPSLPPPLSFSHCAGWLIKIHYCCFFPVQPVHEVQRSSEQPKTAQFNKQPSFFFLLFFFFSVKCATTGLSIDWNKNNQPTRADQQSVPLSKPYRKAWKIRLARRSLKWKPVDALGAHKRTQVRAAPTCRHKYTLCWLLHCSFTFRPQKAAYSSQRCLNRHLRRGGLRH